MRFLVSLARAVGGSPAIGSPPPLQLQQQTSLLEDVSLLLRPAGDWRPLCCSGGRNEGGRRREKTEQVCLPARSFGSSLRVGERCSSSSKSFGALSRLASSSNRTVDSSGGDTGSDSNTLGNRSSSSSSRGSSRHLSSSGSTRAFCSSRSSSSILTRDCSSGSTHVSSSSGSYYGSCGRECSSSRLSRGLCSRSSSDILPRHGLDSSSSGNSSGGNGRRGGSSVRFAAAVAPAEWRAAAAHGRLKQHKSAAAHPAGASGGSHSSSCDRDWLQQQLEEDRGAVEEVTAVLSPPQQVAAVLLAIPPFHVSYPPVAGGALRRAGVAAAIAACRSTSREADAAAAVTAVEEKKSWVCLSAAAFYSSTAAAPAASSSSGGGWAGGAAGGSRQHQQQRGGQREKPIEEEEGDEGQREADRRSFEERVRAAVEGEQAAVAGEAGEQHHPTPFSARHSERQAAAAAREREAGAQERKEEKAGDRRGRRRVEEEEETAAAERRRRPSPEAETAGKRAPAAEGVSGTPQKQRRQQEEERRAYKRHVQKVIESERAAEAHESVGEAAHRRAAEGAAGQEKNWPAGEAATADGGSDGGAGERHWRSTRGTNEEESSRTRAFPHRVGGREEQQRLEEQQQQQRRLRVAEGGSSSSALGQQQRTFERQSLSDYSATRLFFSTLRLIGSCGPRPALSPLGASAASSAAGGFREATAAPLSSSPPFSSSWPSAASSLSFSSSSSSSPASSSGGAAAAAAVGPEAALTEKDAAADTAAAEKEKRESPAAHVTVGPRPVYFDYQATTVIDPRVMDAMLPFMYDVFGNPHSSSHALGWEASAAVEKARQQVASILGIKDPGRAREIIFTSGATESNNLAIKGAVRYYCRRGNLVRFNKNSPKRVVAAGGAAAGSSRRGGGGGEKTQDRGGQREKEAAAAAAAERRSRDEGAGTGEAKEGKEEEEMQEEKEEGEEVWYRPRERNHIITTQLEHKCALQCCRLLQVQYNESKGAAGCDVTFLPVDRDGLVDIHVLEKAIRPSTLLVSVMHVNNEIGVMQDLQAIGELCGKRDVLFHTDAAQSVGKIPVDVDKMKIDLLSLSGHKIYGPKGVGALFIRSKKPRVRLLPIIDGGGQERGLRSGTLPTALCVGLGAACDVAQREMKNDERHIKHLASLLLKRVKEKIPFVEVNGSISQRYMGNWNISFTFVEGESLIMSFKNVAVSSGSACTSASLEPSYVLRALGVGEEVAHTSLRFGLGRFTTERDVEMCVDTLAREVKRLRDMSPLYELEMAKQRAQSSGLCPNDETDPAATLVWT